MNVNSNNTGSKKQNKNNSAGAPKNENAPPKKRGITFKNNTNVREINREGKSKPVTGMKTRTRMGSVRAEPGINHNKTRRNASAALIAAHAWKSGDTIEDMLEVVDRSAASANAKIRARTFIWNKWYAIHNLRRPAPTAPASSHMNWNNDDLYS